VRESIPTISVIAIVIPLKKVSNTLTDIVSRPKQCVDVFVEDEIHVSKILATGLAIFRPSRHVQNGEQSNNDLRDVYTSLTLHPLLAVKKKAFFEN